MLLGLQLRDYQKRAIAEIYAFYRSGIKSVLLYAPTGAGKTVVAAKVIADAVSKGRRVLFVVHRVKLIGQTLQTLQKHYGIQGAMIWADNPTDYSKPVQVAMAQTLQFRDLPDNIGLVIVDEAHTLAYYQIMTKLLRSYSGGVLPLSQSYFLGLSGSPGAK
jgi:superfamily II DNA or RNA helicase